MKAQPEPPSDDFNATFCHSASLVIDCEFCGRTFFGSGGDYEDGELERFEEKAKAEPEKYIQGQDYWHWYLLAGKQFVIGCPCNAAAAYENFIWNHRHDIVAYLRRRATDIAKDQQRVLENLPQL